MAWVHVFPRLALLLMFLGSGRWPVSSQSSPAPLVPGAVMVCPDSGAGRVTPTSEAGQVCMEGLSPAHTRVAHSWVQPSWAAMDFSSSVSSVVQ